MKQCKQQVTAQAVLRDMWEQPTPASVRFTYPPEVFGYLVAEVLKQYTPAQRTAFRAGFLSAMLADSHD